MSDNNTKPQSDSKGPKFNYYWIYGIIFLGILALYLPFDAGIEKITETTFFEKYLPAGDVKKVVIVNDKMVEVYIKESPLKDKSEFEAVRKSRFSSDLNPGPHYYFTIGSIEFFENRLDEKQKSIIANAAIADKASYQVIKDFDERADWKQGLLTWVLPLLIIVGIWIFIMRRVSGGMGAGGGQIFNIGKSKATLFDQDTKVKVDFNHVAGLEEAKEEVMEIVDFLKNPGKYTALGGKIPKGCLLVGPPGTGKTLIAKAMAGEAEVPFFSISGSDFVELFVGVGASRVRDLFKQAREKAPCIVFIDEIDAIGRSRGRNNMQGNDERENTLNQLLVEMDGFAGDKGVIILAATNRPDVLDSALLRPGRFDRQIAIDKPDLKGREKIFKVHMDVLKVAGTVDVNNLAARTPGFAGADIANVCNEAALIAARHGKTEVQMIDFQDAIDRSIGGLERKNKLISPEEKEIIAYHEAGHAISGWFLKYAHPLLKVSIVPRGLNALGYAQYIPKEQYLYTKEQLMDEMCMTLGGRVAEDIIFGRISTGAQNDLEKITKMCYAMVTIYGMNDKIGNVSFHDPQQEYNFQKPYSDETAKVIDDEVRSLIEKAYEKTKNLLTEKRKELEIVAKALLSKEILLKTDLENLIGKRPSEVAPALVNNQNTGPISG